MSLLTEVADLAEVPVEGVVRVLTQKPVGRRTEQRVLAVVNELDDTQLRALTRYALAAAPSVLAPPPQSPRGPSTSGPSSWPSSGPSAAPTPAAETAHEAATAGDELTVRLGRVLDEFVGSLKELKRDHVAERQDRLDDLSVLIDLISTGWSGIDRRLGRLERTLERLELERRVPPPPPPSVLPPAVLPPPVIRARAAPPPAAAEKALPIPAPIRAARATGSAGEDIRVDPVPDPDARSGRRLRFRWPSAATPIAFVVLLFGSLLLLELLPSRAEAPRLAGQAEGPAERDSVPPVATPPVSATGASATSAAATDTAPPPTTTALATTEPLTTGGAALSPTRVFSWLPVESARYYVVTFARDGERLYRAWPTAARVTLPARLALRPGSYRWVVRPGFGKRGDRRVGLPVLTSAFTIGG